MKFDAQKIIPPYVAMKILIEKPDFDIKGFSEVIYPLKGHHDLISKLAQYVVEFGYSNETVKLIVDKMVSNKDYIEGFV